MVTARMKWDTEKTGTTVRHDQDFFLILRNILV